MYAAENSLNDMYLLEKAGKTEENPRPLEMLEMKR